MMQWCISRRSKGTAATDQDDPIEEDDDVDDQDRLPPRLSPHQGKKGRRQVCSSTHLCPLIASPLLIAQLHQSCDTDLLHVSSKAAPWYSIGLVQSHLHVIVIGCPAHPVDWKMTVYSKVAPLVQHWPSTLTPCMLLSPVVLLIQ